MEIFGYRPVEEALLSGKKPERILFRIGMESPSFRRLKALADENHVPCQFVPEEKLHHLSKGGNHQGVAAIMPQIDYMTLEEAVTSALEKQKDPIVLLLDGVSDVRNFGAIARTAECAGVQALFLPSKGGAALNAESIRASAGALLRMPCCKTANLREAVYYLKESGFTIVGATEKASDTIYSANFTQPVAVIMGDEGKGISSSLLSLCDCLVKIPLLGNTASLNVSAASAIVLFEIVRQRIHI